jgi:hypothetical protein
VTLSFTPPGAGEYLDTLIIRADYAEEYRIPLSGAGINDPVGIPGSKLSGPDVSVRNGNISVSGAPANSLIRVYNLHGQALITQTVTSDVEILKTASFPRGIYIVLVKDSNKGLQPLVKKVAL